MPMIERQTVDILGIPLEIASIGSGPPLLFLHGGEAPDVPNADYLIQLAERFRVIAPWHPGFGRLERPKRLREASDLVYLYLELAEKFDLRDATLAGASFGGWLATEMAVRDTRRFASLVLISPLGIKIGKRDERDIVDLFAMSDEDFADLAYFEPAKAKRDIAALSDEDLAAHFRSKESLAFFAWKPYLHNPRLLQWLPRIRIPTTILTGTHDRVVAAGYYKAFERAIAGSTLRTVERAGHYPHIEQPTEATRLIVEAARATTRLVNAA